MDFTKTINDLNGNALRVGGSQEALIAGIQKAMGLLDLSGQASLQACLMEATGAAMSMGAACADALIAPLPGEDNLPLGERSKRLKLAMSLLGDEANILPADREMIKECVTKYFKGALIPARIAEFLEGN